MYSFRVWAPLPSKVELQLGSQRLPMNPGGSGWWTLETNLPYAPADYGFVLDGEGPFPDPRSPWQPNGVQKLSRIVDQSAFPWTDGNWQSPPLSSAIFYELHIGTFTPEGTFTAAIDKLDHLVALGITHAEIMPVNEFPGERGWGYDGVDLFAPHHAYGGPEELKQFVQACHARKLAVILDVVYNHLGHTGNFLGRFGPYFTTRYSTPWGPAVNFDDRGSDEVRRFFCDNALMWLRDYHFDGLRLDAVHAIVDTSAEHFLEQLKREVTALEAQLGRRLVLIAESDLNDPRLLWSWERGGFNLDAQWSDDFHHALHTLLTGETTGYYSDFGSLSKLGKAIRQSFVYDGQFSAFRGRRHGRSPEGLSGHRFVICLQNHDQIGNRARGERIHHIIGSSRREEALTSPEKKRSESPQVGCHDLDKTKLGLVKIGTALLLTGPFPPLLFQGQEWAASSPFLFFTDHDRELGEMIREGRRREFAAFGWKPEEVPDPQALETFQASKLDWSELSRKHHAELLEWHRQLICLRRTEPVLTDGCMESTNVHWHEADRWLVVERGPFIIACNFASQAQTVVLSAGAYEILLASGSDTEATSERLRLPCASVAILKRSG